MSTMNDRTIRATLIARRIIRPASTVAAAPSPIRVKADPQAIRVRRVEAVTASSKAMAILREAALKKVLRQDARSHIGRIGAAVR